MRKPKSQISPENVGKVFRDTNGNLHRLLSVVPEPVAEFISITGEAVGIVTGTPEKTVTKPLSFFTGWEIAHFKPVDAPKRTRKAAPKAPERHDPSLDQKMRELYPPDKPRRTRSDKGKKRDSLHEKERAALVDRIMESPKPFAQALKDELERPSPLYFSIVTAHDGEPYKISLTIKGGIGEGQGTTLREAFANALLEAGATVADFDGIDTPEAQALREALK